MKLLAIELPVLKGNKRHWIQDYRSIWFALTVTFSFFLWIGFLFVGYWAIGQLDEKAYYRIATKGKFSEDVYFTVADREGTNISPIVDSLLQNGIDYTRPQETFYDLLEHEKEFIDLISSNKEYMNYLNEIGSTVEDVIFYVKVIADLDNIMLRVSSYIVSLIVILICHFVLKFRIEIYILTALLYFFLKADGFTSGLISSALYPHLTKEMQYTDYMLVINSFLPAIIEAALTFIIIDTVGQHQKKRKEKIEISTLRYTYFSLEKSIQVMKDIQNHSPNIKIKDINVKLQPIYYFCEKYESDEHLALVKKELEKLTELVQESYTNSQLLESTSYIVNNLKKSETFIDRIIG